MSAAPPSIAKPKAKPLAVAKPAAKPTNGEASASSSASSEDDDSMSAAPPAAAKPKAKPNAFDVLMGNPTNGKATSTSSSSSSEDDDESTSAAPPAAAKPKAKPNGDEPKAEPNGAKPKAKAKAKSNGGKPAPFWAKPMTMVGKVSAYDKKWLENLNVLRPCIQEGGAIDYSSLPEDERKHMQSFVKDQRKCYKKRASGEKSPLTDERLRLLKEANFDFDPTATSKGESLPPPMDGIASGGIDR